MAYSGRRTLRIERPVVLRSGATLDHIDVAYETWGVLSSEGTNVVLVCHALSGDSHVAADPGVPGDRGWWDDVVGPGKAIDTDRYHVICSNVLGGCSGTTGPGSERPDGQGRYGLDFPLVSVEDMVDVQVALLEQLGIDRVRAVVGGSMGGMQALVWARDHADKVDACVAVATTWRVSAQAIAFDEVGRQAILGDPAFEHGDYRPDAPPARGLATARMIGHITYLSDHSMDVKFGRSRRAGSCSEGFEAEFEVEHYLGYQGRRFVERFDANTYLYLTRAVDQFSLALDGCELEARFADSPVRFLLIPFSSDWLFPPYQARELADALCRVGADVTYACVDSPAGHDAFLLEPEALRRFIEPFIARESGKEVAR